MEQERNEEIIYLVDEVAKKKVRAGECSRLLFMSSSSEEFSICWEDEVKI